jgi:hypothetical protein
MASDTFFFLKKFLFAKLTIESELRFIELKIKSLIVFLLVSRTITAVFKFSSLNLLSDQIENASSVNLFLFLILDSSLLLSAMLDSSVVSRNFILSSSFSEIFLPMSSTKYVAKC